MADKQKLFARQLELGKEITAFRDKVGSPDYLVRAVTIPQKAHKLSKIQKEFEENHDKLLQSGITTEEYFSNSCKYYDSIMLAAIQALSLLAEFDGTSTATGKKSNPNNHRTQDEKAEQLDPNIMALIQSLEKKSAWLENWVDELGETERSVTNEQLDVKKQLLEKRYKAIEEIYSKISISVDAENAVDMDDIEVTYFHGLEILASLRKEPNRNFHVEAEQNNVRLGNIKIPDFFGDINEWATFHDMFVSLVHNCKQISDVEKMYYLKSSVKGEANKLIQHLKVTDINYHAAFDILKQRYENHRLLFSTQVDILLDQPMANSESAVSLKQLLDTTNSCIHALKAMGVQLTDAEPFIARIVIRKLDKDGLRFYEQNVKKAKEIQSLEDVLAFLEQQVQALEAVSKRQGNKFQKKVSEVNNSRSANVLATTQQSCHYCNKGHLTLVCRKLQELPVIEKRLFVKKNKLCFQCLSHKFDMRCQNKTTCNVCQKKHHSMLHIDENSTNTQQSMVTKKAATTVLLATAQVKIRAATGEDILVRALIDQGSQITAISEEAAQILSLPRIREKTEIHGLGNAVVGVSKSKLDLEIKPRFLSNRSVKLCALVLPSITGAQPDKTFNARLSDWKNVTLADPMFFNSDRIDLVIGGDVYGDILIKPKLPFQKEGILAQSTIFGWILSGAMKITEKPSTLLSAVTNLERFWELEEVSSNNNENIEDKACLEQFERTTKIGDDGKIVVKLPMKDDIELGDSRKQAMARFLSLEKKLNKNKTLKDDYANFMREYLELGHMDEAKLFTGKYYLPHQAVIREGSLTTKLRVVFDASAKTTNGKSLNDIMYAGPKLQRDIFDILLKWRLWRFVMTADVEKMYRQVKVAEEDQLFQYILWRENCNDAIKEYKLNTVSYGTASAPFLAVRALFFIADSCSEDDQLIKNIIKEDFYMDDLMSGADTLQDCKTIQHKLITYLKRYGFNLRKWLSNQKKITDNIQNYGKNSVIEIEDDGSIKTLGLQWDPSNDLFGFNINFVVEAKLTKRLVLSAVARIFDPLGWLSPVTILAKLFVQKLWLRQSSWDEELPKELQEEWDEFMNYIAALQQVKIPRWVKTKNGTDLELHGFADASGFAYAAAIYLKIDNCVMLLTAKSKVNPIKNRKTLPKLELTAAHLLARLLHKVVGILNRSCKIYAWSDSTITLGWIQNNRNKEKFIRNRVDDIKSLLPKASWHHVSGKENPADVASRGIYANKLICHTLWWSGPAWLSDSEEFWPKYELEASIVISTTSYQTQPHFIYELLEKYSSFTKLNRVVAYILRIAFKLKTHENFPEYLTAKELIAAEKYIILHHQKREFFAEIKSLQKNQPLQKDSKIIGLYPFIDSDGILRVGGRLQNSDLQFDQKHPVILQKSHLSSILIHKAHMSTLHGGNRLVEATLRRKYWIVGMKNCIKKIIRGCARCIRFRQESAKQMMGNLPEPRVSVSFPFLHTGVDYAGPIHIRCSKGRGQKSYKGYIAVFVCMATKAVHLEAVSDLTTEAFLAALKRFFARRGTSSHMYSDNGTNFVGAKNKLDADYKAAVKNNKSVIPILAAQKIQWHHSPPAAPHFGGIWEAGVKSVKYHLKRVIGDTKLTYEEMSTLLSQIEAVLNSRPLIELSSDDSEGIDVLCPGHFLIGRPVLDCPENINDAPISSLNRWKMIQKLRKDFWNRWKEEYLTTLQQRRKWLHPETNIKEGTVVLIKDETTHPAKWPLGKVIEVHEGKDGKIRVTTLKLQNSVIKRPIHKLCPLQISEEPENIMPSEKVNCMVTRAVPTANSNFEKMCGLMLLLLMICCNQINAAAIKNNGSEMVHQLSPNTAIYLDNIGQLNVINSKWNLVIFYDLTLFQDEMARIQTLMGKIDVECPNLKNYKSACDMVMMSMKRRYAILKQNNELLINKDRNKRAPFEFVGSLHRILFGTMDADDRDVMEENMRNLLQNQENLKQLYKEQTSVVDATLNVLKKTTDEVNSNFNKMYSQMTQFYDELQNEQNAERVVVFFQVMTTQLNMMIEECEKIQSSVINLLIDINHGHINPDLLTPAQLKKEILNIMKLLPATITLPGKDTGTEMKEIYSLMSAKGVMVDGRLVVHAEIPLISSQQSEIYKLIRLPVKGNFRTILPKIEQEYLVYNFALNSYFLISHSQLNECTKNLRGQYNCAISIPWKPAIEGACEISALQQSRYTECQFEEVAQKSIWKEISAENHWIFALFEKFVVSINCGHSNRKWIDLPPKGILKLSSGCTANYDGLTLRAMQQTTTEEVFIIKTPSWSVDIEAIEANMTKPLSISTIDNSRDIDHLRQQVEKMKATNIELKNLQFHTLSGHTSLTLILIIIAIGLCFYIKLKCCNRPVVKLDFTPPAPIPPRQNVHI